jgi:hypothetical protein
LGLVVCPYDQQILQTFVSNHIIAEQIDTLLAWCKYAFKKIQITSGDMRSERDKKEVNLKSSFSLNLFILQSREHEDECIYRFVPCPNGCLLNNLRQKVSNHIY